MGKYDKLKKQSDEAIEKVKKDAANFSVIADESRRVADVAHHAGEIISDLDRQFAKATGLDGKDIAFLFLATGLQCIRQYILTKFPERMDDKEAAKNTKGHEEEHSNRIHRYYNPSIEEIRTNPVPFDAIKGSPIVGSPLKGGGRLGHRVTAIGHDPILGLVFGTANIATSTLTNFEFHSFHITTVDKMDCFKNHASTQMVLSKTMEKLLDEGLEGKIKVALSLKKEIDHLKSDIGSKHSLPLPFVSVINPQMASELAKYGLDMANLVTVGKQMSYAVLINSFIAMLHKLLCDESVDGDIKMYSVRTRKILSYSNVIASVSNIIRVGVGVYVGDENAIKDLDVGGLLVTIHRLLTDYKFIQSIKQEFLQNQWYEIVMGEELKLTEEE